MPFDDDFATGLAALAARVHPNPGNPEGLLRLHAARQRRRVAVRGGAFMAVTATGAVLTLPHVGEGSGRVGLATGPAPTPMVHAVSDCPGVPDPVPTPVEVTATPSNADGPQPTRAANTPPSTPEYRIPARLTKAIVVTAPAGVTQLCDLGSELLYRAGGTHGPVIDVAAGPWTGPAPAPAAGSRVTRLYANGDEYRSTFLPKVVMVELWTDGDLITWTVEPSSATPGARVEDLELWADRLQAALN